MLDRFLRPPAVLAYHGVSAAVGDDGDGADPERLVLSPARFASQVAYLRRLGYRFLTASALAADAAPAPGTAALTFDDGWADGLEVVEPLLRRHHIPATFYVCAGWLGGHHPQVPGPAGRLLDGDGLARLCEAGMEIGSHSMAHRDLRLLADSELADDLRRSKQVIEDATGRPCRTLAYPYGLADARVEAAAMAAGYELAFGWWPGPWRREHAPRLPAPPRHGAGRLALKLVGVRPRPRPYH
jgi:peptidoglycan/xylan/chitin deacetylase (PgdA/CDA1 family)